MTKCKNIQHNVLNGNNKQNMDMNITLFSDCMSLKSIGGTSVVTQCVISSVYCPTLRKGMMLSLAIACRSRGAPVRDCRPAPIVEKNEPMTMTHGDGQESVPTTKFFLTASPNLQVNAD